MHLLKEEVVEKLRANVRMRKYLADAIGCHELTVKRWADENHPSLTCWTVLCFLQRELGISKAKLVEKV